MKTAGITPSNIKPSLIISRLWDLVTYEYFLLSEDLGAEPLPVISCGLSCQYESNEVVPMDELDPYIQDALDLIEFANGPVTSKWGKVRADMGHPEPFNLKMIGIGNEQWDKVYVERSRSCSQKPSVRNTLM